jgi:hypothetical protein
MRPFTRPHYNDGNYLEVGPGFLELCLQLHGLVVEDRELRLQAFVLRRFNDHVLWQSRQLHLEALNLFQATLVVLVGRLLQIMGETSEMPFQNLSVIMRLLDVSKSSNFLLPPFRKKKRVDFNHLLLENYCVLWIIV